MPKRGEGGDPSETYSPTKVRLFNRDVTPHIQHVVSVSVDVSFILLEYVFLVHFKQTSLNNYLLKNTYMKKNDLGSPISLSEVALT